MPLHLSTRSMLDEVRLRTLEESWRPVEKGFQLTAPKAAQRAKALSAEAGTYLWTLVVDTEPYTLYIGKCTNLAKRIYAYTQSFQPHAPNDRKLAFSQLALRDQFPKAEFDLYFKPCRRDEIDRMEAEEIRAFSPLLNQRVPLSPEARLEFEAMYQAFYRRVLSAAFGDA